MTRKIITIAAFSFLLIGCGLQQQVEKPEMKAATDLSNAFTIKNYASDLSEHTYIYYKHPERIVALWQNSVETLIALGAAEKIVAVGGVTNEQHLKPEFLIAYKNIPVKSKQIFSQEEMLLLKPDFILGWLFDFSGRGRSIGTTAFWEKRNTNIYMNLLDLAEFKAIHTIEDELQYITDIGKIVGQEEKAQDEIKKIRQQIDLCHQQAKSDKKPKVLIISNVGKTLSIYTPRTLAGDIVTQLGGTVLGVEKQSIGENEFLSYEEILMLDPDVIFLQSAPERDALTLEMFYSVPVLRNLKCVKNKKVYCIPFYTIRSPGIRIIDAIEIFAGGLQVKNVNVDKK